MINTGTATPRLDLLGPILVEGFSKEQYILQDLLPPLPVEKKKGAIPSFLLTNDQIITLKRDPRGAFRRITSQLGEKYYTCEDSGIEEAFDHNDYEILGVDGAQMAVGGRLIHAALRTREFALASATLSAAGEATFAGQVTDCVNAWDVALGDPYANIADSQTKLVRRIGMPGNCLFFSYAVAQKLKKNAKVQANYRNLLGYSGENVKNAVSLEIDAKAFALMFGVERVLIGAGIYNTANQGVAANRQFIWPSTYAGLARISTGGATANETAFGRLFAFDLAYELGDLAAGSRDDTRALMLEEYRDETVASDILRVRDHTGITFLVPEAIEILKNL